MARDVTRLDVKWRDYIVAALLFVISFAAIGMAQRDQGVVRDESHYYTYAERYWRWFAEMGDNFEKDKLGESFTDREITKRLQINMEHPFLLKMLFSVSWRFLADPKAKHYKHPYGKNLGWMSQISAYRMPAWLFGALGVALIYLFGVRIESRLTGLVAALLYLTIPRVFFHAQLACFDSPITTMWLLVVYAYFRALSRARWSVFLGLFFGVALATKLNAFFLPPLLLLHYLVVVWPDLSLRPLRLPRAALGFWSMAVLGPLVFYALWPWLWHHPIKRIAYYLSFHLKHPYYNMEYLGTNWGPPPLPMSYPFGMTLFTLPTVMVVLALAGMWIYGRGPVLDLLSRWTSIKPRRFDDPYRYPAKRSWLRPATGLNPRIGTLLGINALVPLLIIAMPSTPIFGGTKHWMPAYPFLALLAGVALSRLVDSARVYWRRLPFPALLLPIIVVLPGALNTMFTHPFGLSQYNALAGGPAGGADLGLNRQFWGYATRQLLPWMNETFEKNANVYFHDTDPSAHRAYIHDGLLRRDIRYAGMELPAIRRSSAALVVYELHFNKYDYWIWDAYGSPVPDRVLSLDNVPLVSVYRTEAAKARSQREKKP